MNQILAAILNAMFPAALLVAAVWLVLRIAPRRMLNAATRYAIWWTVLLAVALLPLLYLPQVLPHFEKTVEVVPAVVATTIKPQSNFAGDQSVHAHSETVTTIISDSASRFQFPVEIPAGAWTRWIGIAWCMVASAMLLRLVLSYAYLELRKSRANAPRSHLVSRVATWRSLCGTSRDIRMASSMVASPMAAGLFRPVILMPARLLEEMNEDEIDQIGLHETAHLARWDDYALLFERTIEALFAFHPLVRWIARQIDLEREIACDDLVVELTGRARPYAACLTRVVELAAELAGASRLWTTGVAGAAEERSHLARRIDMLLDKTRNSSTGLRKLRLAIVMVAALVALAWVTTRTPELIAFAAWQDPPLPPVAPEPPAAPEAPATPAAPAPLDIAAPEPPPVPAAPPALEAPGAPEAPPAPPAPPEPQGQRIQSRWNDGLNSRDLRVDGVVAFTDDDSDIKDLSIGGRFSYEESHGFSSRRYEVTADSYGRLSRRYFVDGVEKPMDDNARAWLRAALPDLIRDSGIGAADRVRRILQNGGAQAVLAEIAKIHSDGAKKMYIRELASATSLSVDQYQTLLREVREMNSDGEKAGTLILLTPYALKDRLRTYMFEATATIHSDGEKRRTLGKFADVDPSRETLVMIARTAEGIHSDGEKASILIQIANHYRGNAEMRSPFFRSTESINSDGEKARVLMAVIAEGGDQRDTLIDALHATQGIHSDGDKARVLVHAASYWKDDDAVRRVYFDAARSINSDGEKARVLVSVVGQQNFSESSLVAAARCAQTINSDGEKARALLAILTRSNNKPAARAEVKTVADSIHSDGEYRRVMNALNERSSR